MSATDDPQVPKPRLRKLHEPPPADKRTLLEKHQQDLKSSGLADETIRAAGLYSEERPHALTEICGRKYPPTCGPSLVFPFHLPGNPKAYAFRIKPANPRLGKPNRKGIRKAIKYDQSSEAGLLVYLPPWARESGALGDITQPLYFTEGEKKSLALDQLRLPTVGLCGVWAYVDKSPEAPANDAPERLHKTIRDHCLLAGRVCIIAYDADAKDNPDVMLAAGRLAGVLMAAGAIDVKLVVPPSKEHKGIDDFLAVHGEQATRSLLDSALPIEPISPREPAQRVVAIKSMRDAPIDPDLRCPLGYTIENDGTLWKASHDEKHTDVHVARGPILITRYLEDYYDHEVRCDVAFQRDGRWVTTCVDRKFIVDSRSMVNGFAQFGAPITSNNAARMIDFVDEYEHVNRGKVPRIQCVSRAGWHTIDGVRVFVADEPIFADPEDVIPLALDTRGDRRRMFEALKPRKNLAAHTQALADAVAADPICAAVIFGALAAPLLDPLGCPNFALHLPGDSSRGKTTILKMAGSVYGDPNNEHWIANWNTTVTAAEMRAAVLCDLPLCFDEVSAAERVQIDRMIYMLINGGGKSRSQRDLTIRETKSWRTIVLSTGERGLAEESSATGAQVRVIQLPVQGIGNLDGSQIDALREACVAHAGAFGRMWLEELLAIQDWPRIRDTFAAKKETMRALAVNNLQHRTSAYWALLAVAESLAHGFGIGLRGGATVIELFQRLSRSGDQLRPASERARQHVEEWTSIEPRAFPELRRNSSGDDAPARTAHTVVHGYLRIDGAIVFWPQQLRTYLESKGFAYEQVCRDWHARGWLEAATDGRWQKPVLIDGRARRMVVLLPLANGEVA